MTRQLSVPKDVIDRIQKYGIIAMYFIDLGKNEQWKFHVDKVLLRGEMKKVGQEQQWYFPIELAHKKPLKEPIIYK